MNHHRRSFLYLAALMSGASASTIRAAPTLMDERQFWTLIHTARAAAGANLEARSAWLQSQLSSQEPTVIQAFQRRYEAMLLQANRWSLWGASYLMNGGSSDDGFRYFRDWLISEGKETYESAIADPDSLVAQQRRDYFELESFGYAAAKAFAAKGAGELERDFKVELAVPQGKKWTEPDLPKLLPRLASKYLAK